MDEKKDVDGLGPNFESIRGRCSLLFSSAAASSSSSSSSAATTFLYVLFIVVDFVLPLSSDGTDLDMVSDLSTSSSAAAKFGFT